MRTPLSHTAFYKRTENGMVQYKAVYVNLISNTQIEFIEDTFRKVFKKARGWHRLQMKLLS